MSIDERASELAQKLEAIQGRSGLAYNIIRRALLEQDKITRHACAEEVLGGSFWNDAADADVIRVDFAHNAIMNCRGGVE